ncbi:sulfotransferase 6B1-like [Protopterus annectens]|uniref:sulfotransferase 6B1-like n=1 Tax=Protopterus annectens TaxID=7888 RepID=UPI001CFA0F0C|nr:sulfotransferase 6B1-like [Protopterus annectens]
MADGNKVLLERYEEVAKVTKPENPEGLILHYRGYQYPSKLCSTDTFQALEKLEARKEDVLLLAYPKCGYNWVKQLLHEIVAYVNPKTKEDEDYVIVPMLEFERPERLQKAKKSPSPRVFGAHLCYDEIPVSFFEKKTKMLVVFRNPKDTAVSYFHFCNGLPVLPSSTWDEFFNKFMAGDVCWGSYFNYALTWNKHIDDENVLIITYEDLKMNLGEQLKQITEFYGFTLSEEQLQVIVNGGTFTSMKESSKEVMGPFCDVVFRKGEIGDWKNYFTEAQSKEMDAKFEECLAGTKLGKKLNYDLYCKA